jgi:hypothetical protein
MAHLLSSRIELGLQATFLTLKQDNLGSNKLQSAPAKQRYNRRLLVAPISFREFSSMSPIINPESAGKERTQLSKAIVLAVRELAKQTDVTYEAKDLAAFIAIALKNISEGIDVSVAAWEKRGYWVKADRFRMEWLWTGSVADKMKVAIFTNDWGTIAMLMPQIAQKFSKIMVSDNHRLGKPWVGSFQRLTGQQ